MNQQDCGFWKVCRRFCGRERKSNLKKRSSTLHFALLEFPDCAAIRHLRDFGKGSTGVHEKIYACVLLQNNSESHEKFRGRKNHAKTVPQSWPPCSFKLKNPAQLALQLTVQLAVRSAANERLWQSVMLVHRVGLAQPHFPRDGNRFHAASASSALFQS